MLKMLLSAIIGFLGIGIMVLVHEGGHYLAARAFGINVEVFSFGMGPKLWGWKQGGTEFRISWLPFGGYCRMKGSDDLSRALELKQKRFEHAEVGSLFSVSPWRRLFTFLSGPLANIIFAVIVYTIFSMMSYQTLSDPAVIVISSDYPTLFQLNDEDIQLIPSKASGLQTGDTITHFNGNAVEDYQHLLSLLAATKGNTEHLTVMRDGVQSIIPVTPIQREDGSYLFGITSFIEPVVERVVEGSPEQLAGLKAGDRILALEEAPITNMLDLSQYLANNPIETRMLIQRGTQVLEIQFSPTISDTGKATFQFSLHSELKKVQGNSLGKSIGISIKQAFIMIGNTFKSIWGIICGNEDIRSSFTGPWRASMMIGDITTQGFADSPQSGIRAMFYLLGVVSVSLAVANLLPIPALDGGMIMMSIVEIIIKRQLSPKTYLTLQFIGLGCVLLIIGFMTLNDFRYLWMTR